MSTVPLLAEDSPPPTEAEPPDPPFQGSADEKFTLHFISPSAFKVTKREIHAHFRSKLPNLVPAVDYAVTAHSEEGKLHLQVHTTCEE